MPTADEIFEGEKYIDKVWMLLKTVFELFAMHEVNNNFPKILKWMNLSLAHFPGRESIHNRPE